MMKSLISSALALAALSVVGTAQSQATPIQVQGTPGHATIKMATGELIRGTSQDKAAALAITWANTDYSGYYSTGASSEVWLDWGTLNSTLGSEIVSGYQFAYGTTTLDTSVGGPGVSLCTEFYENVVGWCAESGLGYQPDASFCFSGLPGSSSGGAAGWIITVDLTCGFEFEFPNGNFGYGLNMLDPGTTGPLLCYAGSISGGADANGQIDVFDIYNPDLASGTCGSYWFGGRPHNFSAWWLYIEQADAGASDTASCTFYCGNNVNQNGFTVTANAVLGGTFGSSVTHSRAGAVLYAYATPLTFVWKGDEILINFTDPNGMLYGSPPLTFGNPANFNLAVPLNLCFCGFTFYTQAAAFGGGIDLQCAYACTIGF